MAFRIGGSQHSFGYMSSRLKIDIEVRKVGMHALLIEETMPMVEIL